MANPSPKKKKKTSRFWNTWESIITSQVSENFGNWSVISTSWSPKSLNYKSSNSLFMMRCLMISDRIPKEQNPSYLESVREDIAQAPFKSLKSPLIEAKIYSPFAAKLKEKIQQSKPQKDKQMNLSLNWNCKIINWQPFLNNLLERKKRKNKISKKNKRNSS